MASFRTIWHNPLYRFLVVFTGLVLFWFLVYNLWLHPLGTVDLALVHITLDISEWVLRLLGYAAFTEGREIHISGSSGLWMGDACNALPLFALFAGFVIAFPGPTRRKALYISFGILSVFLLNCLRVIILTILDTVSRSWTEFNHSYTFNIILYGYIFLLWYLWVEKYSGTNIRIRKNTTTVE